MDARLYVTDGQKTIKLFWLQYDGKDVHCGLSKFTNKLTYHGSGELHTTQNGQNINRDWRAPLAGITGLMHLTTISSIPQLLAYSDPISNISRKSDAILLIDLRPIPKDADLHIAVGLLERGRLDAISPMLVPIDFSGIRLAPQQAFFITSVDPWVWAVLYWWHR
jgi:hypothetical protein